MPTEEDAWLNPLDSRVRAESCCVRWGSWLTGALVSGAGLVGLTIGVGLLLVTDAHAWEPYPAWMKSFVFCSMVLEAAIWILAAASMSCLYVTLGRNAVVHALSVISLTSDGLLSIAYIICACWSSVAVYKLAAFCHFSPHHWWSATSAFNHALTIYVLLSCALSLGYTIARIPLIVGVFGFTLHQVRRKIKHTPIVQFYEQYNRGDEYYIRVMPVDETGEQVELMDNPL